MPRAVMILFLMTLAWSGAASADNQCGPSLCEKVVAHYSYTLGYDAPTGGCKADPLSHYWNHRCYCHEGAYLVKDREGALVVKRCLDDFGALQALAAAYQAGLCQ
jgi:hypothetical protein